MPSTKKYKEQTQQTTDNKLNKNKWQPPSGSRRGEW